MLPTILRNSIYPLSIGLYNFQKIDNGSHLPVKVGHPSCFFFVFDGHVRVFDYPEEMYSSSIK